jgi:hypothetical protein
MTPDQQALRIRAISQVVRPLLHGHPPEVQGAVLADLLSLFIAGHHPALREEILQEHIKIVRELVGPSEAEIFEQRGGRPQGWEKQ